MSGRDCRWGDWITSALSLSPSIQWLRWNPLLPGHRSKWLPTAPVCVSLLCVVLCVCVCVCVCVCAHLDWLMQSINSEYGSPHVISLTRINSPRLVSGAKWFWELMAGYWKLHLCLFIFERTVAFICLMAIQQPHGYFLKRGGVFGRQSVIEWEN